MFLLEKIETAQKIRCLNMSRKGGLQVPAMELRYFPARLPSSRYRGIIP
jgi:hypothetical protein